MEHTAAARPAAGRLAELMRELAAGRFPPADGAVEVVAAPRPADRAVLAFCAHHVVVGDVEPAWVRGHLPAGDLSAPHSPRFLLALGRRLGAVPGSLDLVLCAVAGGSGGPGPPASAPPLEEVPQDHHPRVRRARRYRDEVRVLATPDGAGLLVLGRGLAGRWEASFEVAPASRGQGLGRRLAAAALGLVPAGAAVFVQVAPGNVASLRAVLAAGFRPVGAEVLLVD